MKFGLLALFESPEGRDESQVISDQIDLMVAAEDLGFDSVWPAEHHFTEYGYCASPAVTLAAVAARTNRIRLGTGVVVLPLNHPVRIAEDFAFLDRLSDGRVELGVGRGYQPAEFAGYNVDPSRSREMMNEALEVILGTWTQDDFCYDGDFYHVEHLHTRPRPIQQPHPPVWMAALSEESFAMCGRLGLNLLCAPVFGFDLRQGASFIAGYRQALAAAGHTVDDREIAALTITYVADTSQQARAELQDAVLWYYRTLAKHIAPAAGSAAIRGYESYGRAREFLETVDWDTVLEQGAVICGSPDEVSDRIAEAAESCGFNNLLAWTSIGGLDRRLARRSMELLAEKVMPRFR